MKNVLPLLLFLFSIQEKAAGQYIFPTYSDSPNWHVLECFWAVNCNTITYSYDYDTLFCGYLYSKATFPDVQAVGYFRSDSQKTFFRKSTNCSDKEYKMYDFSLQVGDTTYVGYDLFYNSGKDTTEMIVSNIDTLNINGVLRKRIHVLYDPSNTQSFFNMPMSWVQGMGSLGHPFYPFTCLWDGCEMSFRLLCQDSSGVQLYMDTIYMSCDISTTNVKQVHSENVFTIYPNPSSGVVIFSSELFPDNNFQILDAMGKIISIQKLNNGIYITENLDAGIYYGCILLKNNIPLYEKFIVIK